MQTKNFYFFICCCFFCVVGSAQNVVSGQITVSGGILLQAVTHIGKRRVSSDVSEIIRSENYQQEISKCSFVGYKSVDTLVNLSVTKF
jgi:hypothetical protein